MRSYRYLLSALIPPFSIVLTFAEPPYLVKEISTDTINGIANSSTSRSGLGQLNGSAIVSLYRPETGTELWRTDGTPGGAQLVKDIYPGPASSMIDWPAASPTLIYFSADDGAHGEELWRTDGTAEGTFLIRDIRLGAGSSLVRYTVVIGDLLYFSADDGIHGREVWVSDGTAEGTRLVADILPGPEPSSPSHFARLNDDVVFAATGPSGRKIWKTRENETGAELLLDQGPTLSLASSLTSIGSLVYFTATGANAGVWRTDGTPGGTFRLTEAGQGPFVPLPDSGVIFPGSARLWRTDGTTAGTSLLKVIAPLNCSTSPSAFMLFGGRVYFSAPNSNCGGAFLWSTDGTSEGTVMIDFPGPRRSSWAPETGYADYAVLNGILYFRALGGSPNADRLWRSDGTEEGTWAVGEVMSIDGIQALPDRLIFKGRTFEGGVQFWSSDGTETGTVQVTSETYQRPSVYEMIGSDGRLAYFTPDFPPDLSGPITPDPTWNSDGTAEGTKRVESAGNPEFGGVISVARFQGHTFFLGFKSWDNLYFWRSDGTPEGTVPLVHTPTYHLDVAGNLTATSRYLFFTAESYYGAETSLWRSDGTAEGTLAVGGEGVGQLTRAGGLVYFTGGPPWAGAELWRSDGSKEGTVMLGEIWPGNRGALPQGLAPLGDLLLFSAEDGTHGRELWRIGNTESTSTLVRDINPGPRPSVLSKLAVAGECVVFFADDGVSGAELWRSDGTTEGTQLVKDIWPGVGDSGPYYLRSDTAFVTVGGLAYFTANDSVHGAELWRTDGTAEGTFMVKDLTPTPGQSSTPWNLLVAGHTLFFTAWTPEYGSELWKTDGTEEGTILVGDINPGSGSSSRPERLLYAGGKIFFVADDGTTGAELWCYELDSVRGPVRYRPQQRR